MNASLPVFTETDLARWIDARSLARGRAYFQSGAIEQPTHSAAADAHSLAALCHGSRATPYRVQATFDEHGLAAHFCTCPFDGRCKHLAALLFAWLDDPAAFTAQADLETRLAQRTPAELIELIQQMIDRQPELAWLLDLPTARDRTSARPIDPELIRRQVQQALRSIDEDDYHAARDFAGEIDHLIGLGRQYATQPDWPNAAIVYDTILREVLEVYGQLHDDGDLAGRLIDCVNGLGDCLAASDDAAQRLPIVQALFDTVAWDIRFGGTGLSDNAYDLLLNFLTSAERSLVGAWVRSALAQTAPDRDYARRAFGGLYLNLQDTVIDDESYLEICREAGLASALLDRLLQLDRDTEAIAVARAASDYELLQLADILVKRERVEIAVQLVRERQSTSKDWRLSEWLKQQAAQRGDVNEVLSLAEQLFRQRPSVEGYQQLHAAAEACQRWDSVRVQALTQLIQSQQFGLLTEIHLLAGDIDATLSTVEKVPAHWWGNAFNEPLQLKVARAAEAERPAEALRLYRAHVARLIDQRGRANYTAAAQHLVRMRAIYQRLDQLDAWSRYFAELRERYRNLRALHQELAKVGLIPE